MAPSRRAWMTVAVWLGFLELLTSLPGSMLPSLRAPVRLDWVAHGCLYGMLGVLLARVGALQGWSRRRLVMVALAVSAFGVLDELHQLFIPGRSAEVGDWIVDTASASLGLAGLTAAARAGWGSWLLS